MISGCESRLVCRAQLELEIRLVYLEAVSAAINSGGGETTNLLVAV